MGRSSPARLHGVIDGTASQVTTTPFFVGDFNQLTVSVSSSATFPTAFGIQLSNADGFQAAIPANSWSTATSIIDAGATGIYSVDAGGRWLRPQAAAGVSAASAYTIRFAGARV